MGNAAAVTRLRGRSLRPAGKPLRSEDRRLALRILLVWLLLEVVAAAQVRRGEEILLVSWLRGLVHPVVVASQWMTDLAGDLVWGVRDSRRLVVENQELRDQLDISRTRELVLRKELAGLREARQLSMAFPELTRQGLIAQRTFGDLRQGRIEISVGLRQGVRPDATVVGSTGLVGRVVHATANRSWVELVINAAAAVAVSTTDGDVRGLVVGSGNGLQVQYVPRQALLVRSAKLVTSGADGIYPTGIPVAQVTSIRQSNSNFLEVSAQPICDPANLRVVLVLPRVNDQDRVP